MRKGDGYKIPLRTPMLLRRFAKSVGDVDTIAGRRLRRRRRFAMMLPARPRRKAGREAARRATLASVVGGHVDRPSDGHPGALLAPADGAPGRRGATVAQVH
jgi:hypothetical protein